MAINGGKRGQREHFDFTRRASIWQLETKSKNSVINHSLGIDKQLLKKKKSYLCAFLRNDVLILSACINFTRRFVRDEWKFISANYVRIEKKIQIRDKNACYKINRTSQTEDFEDDVRM